MSDRPYRVISWGTGAVGGEMLSAIIDHRSDLRLVGARVYSEDKNGADVGTLASRPALGVRASTDVAPC